MEMEVMMIPSPPVDFNFDSASTSPYISAPSSPQRFGSSNFFYSAPTSPARVSAFYHDFHASSAIPFDWEEKPGIPKTGQQHQHQQVTISTATSSNYGDAEQDLIDDTDDFAFDFSGQLETESLPADELFDSGKIKPLKPPPRFHYDQNLKPVESPKSPRSPKEIIREAFSPRHRRKDFDPFEAALEQTRMENVHETRGRRDTMDVKSNNSGSRHKTTRSLSPLRVSDLLFDQTETNHDETSQETAKSSFHGSFSSFWYKKWKIKDLLLFRSASESRATDKEQLKKYTVLKKNTNARHVDDVKGSSFRSTDSVGSVSSRRKTGPAISPHEMHYTMNRAVSEEMRRRTFLPYKQGLLGCLGFHPTANPEISKGIGSASGSLSRGLRSD